MANRRELGNCKCQPSTSSRQQPVPFRSRRRTGGVKLIYNCYLFILWTRIKNRSENGSPSPVKQMTAFTLDSQDSDSKYQIDSNAIHALINCGHISDQKICTDETTRNRRLYMAGKKWLIMVGSFWTTIERSPTFTNHCRACTSQKARHVPPRINH